ncbi:MAG: YegS/Rv2252/BmrU family lipid kinase [Peptococcaceae bacterium]|jgi:YegS/Rv2252/BmrU family lipid kinase|nr:YegS/Rv2252/BmrU family lipid kinase [Peptococcaceae bacterium]
MRKGLLIYNPNSGARSIPKMLDELIAYGYDQGLHLTPFRLDHAAANERFLQDLLQAPWLDFAVAAGGDGTLASVAEQILKVRSDLPLGLLPTGTANDFAKSLKISEDVKEGLRVIAQNKTVACDIGRVGEDRIFLNTCAAGLFVNTSIATSHQLKKALGPLAYYLSALGELSHVRSFPIRIETEAEVVEENILIFLLLNGSQGAGFANLMPTAEMDDGMMDLLLVREGPLFELPQLLIKLLNREGPVDGRWMRHIRARRFRFSGNPDVQTTVDGEEGAPLPFTMEVLERALRVYVP